MNINEIQPNPNNPRFIRDEKFEKLKASIQEFPKMLALRPIVVDAAGVVLGGNMRLRALQDLGYKEVPPEWVRRADDLTEDEKRRFVITDNAGFGQWDWDVLANEWDAAELADWGLDVPEEWGEEVPVPVEDPYTRKVKAPTYEPKNEKPDTSDLVDRARAEELITKIEEQDIADLDKEFLKVAAFRHLVFNYEKIADYYANSTPEVQRLMEDSALVIIDFDKAIEDGYIELSQQIANLYGKEYGDEE